MLRMEERALPLAEKRKPRLVDCGRADRPGMADIQLLDPLIRQIAKLGKCCAAGLKSGERLFKKVLRKIVITRQMLVLRELVIHLNRELIGAFVPERHALKSPVGAIGLRHKSQKVDSSRIEARRGYDIRREKRRIRGVVRNWTGWTKTKIALTSWAVVQDERVLQDAVKLDPGPFLGEIATALGQCWDGNGVGRRAPADAVTLIGSEEKSLVLDDRSTQRGSKLVLQIIQFLRIEKTARIQILVAEKLVRVPVKIVCAGLSDNVHNCSGVAAIFGIKCVCQYTEFGDGVGGGLDCRKICKLVVAVAAVHRVIVVTAAASIDADDPGTIAAINVVHTQLRLHAGLKLQELVSIALGERELAYGAFIDHRAKLRGSGIHQWRGAGHFDRVHGRSHLQCNVQVHNFIQIENNSFAHIFLEASRLRVYFVGSHGNLKENVFPASAGFRISGSVRRLIYEADLGGSNRRAAGVHDRATNAAPGALRVCKGHREENCSRKRGSHQNALAADGTDLPETCIYLHDLTPCPRYFSAHYFFEVAVPLKPYYNPVNLEKAGTCVKQKEFIHRISAAEGVSSLAHQRSGAPRRYFFFCVARLGSPRPRHAPAHGESLPSLYRSGCARAPACNFSPPRSRPQSRGHRSCIETPGDRLGSCPSASTSRTAFPAPSNAARALARASCSSHRGIRWFPQQSRAGSDALVDRHAPSHRPLLSHEHPFAFRNRR